MRNAETGRESEHGEPVTRIRVPARVQSLKRVRALVREAAQSTGCSEECGRDVVIAVDEACQNVIRHAYGEEDRGDILIDISRKGDRLFVSVVDFAPPVDPAMVHPRPLEELRPGGLGTHFIRECMDRVEFRSPPDGAGNHLWMTKKIF